MKIYKNILLPMFLIGILMLSPFIGINPLITKAQENQSSSSSSSSASVSNSSDISNDLVITANSSITDAKMKMDQIYASNSPKDIATLAYIWGYPLVSVERGINYFTNSNVIANDTTFSSPLNVFTAEPRLVNANDTGIVTPNADTLYGQLYANLTKEPIVLSIPPIESDRYSSFMFMDAYTNNHAYLGTRASGGAGGTYLIASPDWNGDIPDGMIKIWSPTELNWVVARILVKGPSDLQNVVELYDQVKAMPLSVYLSNSTSPTSDASSVTTNQTTMTNTSAAFPIKGTYQFIPTTGIEIYDEIGAGMASNQLNPPDQSIVKKFASMGIGPGMKPSIHANDTIKQALQTGITEGEKLIDIQQANFGEKVNGWSINTAAGNYGSDYLLRAATTKVGIGANTAQEATYPLTFVNSEGQPLTGNNNYTIHFEPGQTPPVNGFWSITMYDNQSFFVQNPIDRVNIGQYTEGLKNNTDGSLDIYIQDANPGPDRESNWLPAPSVQDSSNFKVVLRTYLPAESLLNGTWSPPPILQTGQ